MPRDIVSQDPVTIDAQEAKTYGFMRMVDFRARWAGESTQLKVRMMNSDLDGNLSPEGSRTIRVEDLEQQMTVTPKFAQAWDMINDVMGLAYDFYVLRDKVEEAIGRGEDATELIEARNAALAKLREPV